MASSTSLERRPRNRNRSKRSTERQKESFSIDNPAATLPDADPPYPAHQVCRDRKVLNTENLIIPQELVGRRFTYIGFPIKIVGGTGGWIRAVAVLDER